MISVFRGNYHYKFDGKKGVIVNMLTGAASFLSKADIEKCNKSNKLLDDVIKQESIYIG